MRSRLGSIGLFACLASAAFAAGPGDQATTAPKLDVKARYEQLCAGCHGADLRGSKYGSLLGKLRHGDDAEALHRSIDAGFPHRGMPSFHQLPDGEVAALVVYLQERRANQVEPGPAEPLDEKKIRASKHHSFRIEAVVKDGLQVPWSFDFLPDGRILLTERKGSLRLIENGRLLPDPIAGVPPTAELGEGGLMSVRVHPDFARNQWVYLTFTDPGENDRSMTKIVRGRLRGHELTEVETVFALPKGQYQEGYVLFGGRLEFHGEHLFFSVGERGETGAAQRLDVPNGKIHRTFHDGKIPPDNPFVGDAGAAGSIWAYGVRNPQGLAVDPQTGAVWEAEHGPRGGDELNLIEKGKNYGWPTITYGVNYDGTPVSDKTEAPGMEQPVRYWVPSIAASQVAVYRGQKFPRWDGSVFVGSLAQQKFLRFTLSGRRIVEEEEIFSRLGRVRDIRTGPDGLIYIALEQLHGASGWLVRLIPER